MSMIIRTGIAAAVLAAGFGLSMAFAAPTADEATNARQAEMKTNAKALATLVNIIRGTEPYAPETVQASLDLMNSGIATSDAAFAWTVPPDGGAVASRALPAVWSNPDGFTAARKALDDAIGGIAGTTDAASFKAAFPALGQACKTCHEQFRSPD